MRKLMGSHRLVIQQSFCYMFKKSYIINIKSFLTSTSDNTSDNKLNS